MEDITVIRSPTKAATAALVIATLAVGSLAPASAQVAQNAIASVDAELRQTPKGLPGDYEVDALVTIDHSGDQCLCEQTHVSLVAESQAPVEASFEPASYTIDWVQRSSEGERGSHEQPVNVTITVPEVDESPEVTIDAAMEHEPGMHVRSETNPAQIQLPLVGAGSQQLGEQNASDPDGADGEASEDAEAVPWPAVAGLLAPLIATAALTRRRAG